MCCRPRSHYVKDGKFTEGILNRVEAVVRTFDPCLSCSTHAFGQMPLVLTLAFGGRQGCGPGRSLSTIRPMKSNSGPMPSFLPAETRCARMTASGLGLLRGRRSNLSASRLVQRHKPPAMDAGAGGRYCRRRVGHLHRLRSERSTGLCSGCGCRARRRSAGIGDAIIGAAELLALSRDLYGSVPRTSLLLTIGAGSLELREGFSEAVNAALPEARLLLEKTLWRLLEQSDPGAPPHRA